MEAEKLKGHLDLLLLSVLSAGPAHGYEVITRLRQRSDGAFDLPEGTIYPALHRLEGAGLLASVWDVVSGRRRRIYRLTLAGERALADQTEQWRSFNGSIARVLGATVGRLPGACAPGRPAKRDRPAGDRPSRLAPRPAGGLPGFGRRGALA